MMDNTLITVEAFGVTCEFMVSADLRLWIGEESLRRICSAAVEDRRDFAVLYCKGKDIETKRMIGLIQAMRHFGDDLLKLRTVQNILIPMCLRLHTEMLRAQQEDIEIHSVNKGHGSTLRRNLPGDAATL